jgi:hypothetical protein
MLRTEGRRSWAAGKPRLGGGGLNGADRPPARCRGLKLLCLRQMCRDRSQVNAPGFGRARKPEWCGGAPSRASDRREDHARGERRGSPGASSIFAARKPRQRARARVTVLRHEEAEAAEGSAAVIRREEALNAGTKEAMQGRSCTGTGEVRHMPTVEKKNRCSEERERGRFPPKMRAPGGRDRCWSGYSARSFPVLQMGWFSSIY